MTDALLAINAGSSSLKFAVAAAEAPTDSLLWGLADRLGTEDATLTLETGEDPAARQALARPDHAAAVEALCAALSAARPDLRLRAIGHRIVHGGSAFTAPVRISPQVLADLEKIVPLAPLHQPHGIAGIRTATGLFPQTVQVACFDTAFHAGKPSVNEAFALPPRYYDMGLKRYGFHGLACQSVCRALEAEGYPLAHRAIAIAHLGNGCSVTAVRGGRSITNSMGFSALDGLVMGTRCGRIDPGALLHLMRMGLDAGALEDLLYRQSGLLGLSGVSNDMRDLTRAGTPKARAAIDFFVARTVEEICRAAGAMGGLDAVVFSGGIGENATEIREAITDGLSFLPGFDGDGVAILVRPAREETELLLTAAEFLRRRDEA